MSNVDEAFKKVEEEHKVWLKQEEDRVRELNARNSRWAVIEKRNAKRRKERKRAPRTAPGDLEIVQAFVNTKPRWKRKKDELSSPGALGAWLTRHRLLTGSVELTKDDLRRALDVRDGIHALLKANNGAELDVEAVQRLDAAAVGARIEVRFDGDGSVRFVAASSSFADVLGSLLGMLATARLREDWPRFKACADRDCRAAFWAAQMKAKWCSHRCGDRVRGKMRRGAIGAG